jgi:hypothetical protein
MPPEQAAGPSATSGDDINGKALDRIDEDVKAEKDNLIVVASPKLQTYQKGSVT